MGKHAYLIITHNYFEVLKKTLKKLDSDYNDFYIHIDKKIRCSDNLLDDIRNSVKKSKITFVHPVKIYWSGYSMVECELHLLKQAIVCEYEYYHLLSGVDLPLKNSEEIYEYFHGNQGAEFVHISSIDFRDLKLHRYQYYWIFNNLLDVQKSNFRGAFDRTSIKLQKCLHIDRCKKQNVEFYMGSQWFSITHAFAQEIISREQWIKKTFRYTSCADEIFVQTIIMNSKFSANLVKNKFCDDNANNQRAIDWSRGTPYVFRKEDFDELMKSECCFARKFNPDIDSEIIEMICNQC